MVPTHDVSEENLKSLIYPKFKSFFEKKDETWRVNQYFRTVWNIYNVVSIELNKHSERITQCVINKKNTSTTKN